MKSKELIEAWKNRSSGYEENKYTITSDIIALPLTLKADVSYAVKGWANGNKVSIIDAYAPIRKTIFVERWKPISKNNNLIGLFSPLAYWNGIVSPGVIMLVYNFNGTLNKNYIKQYYLRY